MTVFFDEDVSYITAWIRSFSLLSHGMYLCAMAVPLIITIKRIQEIAALIKGRNFHGYMRFHNSLTASPANPAKGMAAVARYRGSRKFTASIITGIEEIANHTIKKRFHKSSTDSLAKGKSSQ